jgi:putative transposase
MPQSLVSLSPLHLVFSTKDRLPFIDTTVENRLYSYIAGICGSMNCPVIEIGGVEDHIHILVKQYKTISVSELLEKIKANSSRAMKEFGVKYQSFTWQRGYGAFAVESSTLEAVRHYIAHQKEHHKGRDFKSEYLLLLKRYGIEYNEQYLWD